MGFRWFWGLEFGAWRGIPISSGLGFRVLDVGFEYDALKWFKLRHVVDPWLGGGGLSGMYALNPKP